MTQDTRLARMLHVLVHMHLRGGTTTSETIALMLHTHPVVVRRTMAALRDAGYVRSTGGRGGGWALDGDILELTVREVHAALAPNTLFAIGPAQDNPNCPVEQAVNAFLLQAMADAEATWLDRLGHRRLRDLLPPARSLNT